MRRRLRGLTLWGAVAGLLAFGGPAAALDVPNGLSITITDGATEVAPHTTTTYSVELSNSGDEPVTATLVVSVPGYCEVLVADGGAVSGADATWVVTVEPGESAVVSLEAEIGEIPDGELRLTTLASVYLGENGVAGSPLIRSADANTIEGVTDPSISTVSTETPRGPGSIDWIPIIGGAALGALVLGTAIVLAARSVRIRSQGRRAARH